MNRISSALMILFSFCGSLPFYCGSAAALVCLSETIEGENLVSGGHNTLDPALEISSSQVHFLP